jgi:SPX domain protein involved in polyphosphate accumulation
MWTDFGAPNIVLGPCDDASQYKVGLAESQKQPTGRENAETSADSQKSPAVVTVPVPFASVDDHQSDKKPAAVAQLTSQISATASQPSNVEELSGGDLIAHVKEHHCKLTFPEKVNTLDYLSF